MCSTCGCSRDGATTIENTDGTHSHVRPDGRAETHAHAHPQEHEHPHPHEHEHPHPHPHEREHPRPHPHEQEHLHPHEHEQAHPHEQEHLHPHEHEQAHPHEREHPHLRPHGHEHAAEPRRVVVDLEARVLEKNNRLAERNRGWFAGRNVLALNLMSSPGAGKTTLLERTLRELDAECSVLEGDQETARDADRIRATGTPAVQINTGKGCHLEAEMVWHGLERLQPAPGSVLFIENVGNLVCPASFDLGERARVVLFSVTEGDDKPYKYPYMFRVADIVLFTKIDLLPHVDFDLERAKAAVTEVRPGVKVVQLSAKTGEGFADWYQWMLQLRARLRP